MKFFQGYMEGLRVAFGNGQRTKFWEDRWCGDQLLMRAFPSFYLLAVNPHALVLKYMEIVQGEVVWQLIFRRPAFDWEIRDIPVLLGRLDSNQVVPNQEDRKVWVANLSGLFSVRSYVELFDRSKSLQIPWKDIWYVPVPHKIQFFM